MVQTTIEKRFQYEPHPFARFGVVLNFIRTDEGAFLPFKLTCQELGISDIREQVRRIKADSSYAPYLTELPILGERGVRKVLCIKCAPKGFTRFVGKLDAEHIKGSIGVDLRGFQNAVWEVADRLLFPGGSGGLTDHEAPAEVVVRGELHFACLSCGAPHVLVMSGDGSVRLLMGTASKPLRVPLMLDPRGDDDDDEDS